MARKSAPETRRIVNKKARQKYFIHETLEAGITLTGSEVKSLRDGRADLSEGFVRINGYDVTLYGCQIDRYPPATDRNHDPQRKRSLLLHRREIRKLATQLSRTGYTLVPLTIYFNPRGLAKVELGLATGKQRHDRREDLKKRDHQREMDRARARRAR